MTTRNAVSARSSSSHRMREADVVHARAAVALRDRRARGSPARPSCANISRWTSPSASHSADVRRDLRLGEVAHALADEPVLVGQGEVDHGSSIVTVRPAATRSAPGPTDADTLATHGHRRANLTPVLGRYYQREWSHGERPSAVRHRRQGLPRLRQRDRRDVARARPPAGDGRDPRPGRQARSAGLGAGLHRADLAPRDRAGRDVPGRRSIRSSSSTRARRRSTARSSSPAG